MKTGAPRIDAAAVRRALDEAGLRARRRFSQNFLADVEVLEEILGAAGPVAGQAVLEIGPGLGILTGALLDAGAALTAVEIDRDLVALLGGRFADQVAAAEAGPLPPAANPPGTLRLVEADVLDCDLGALVSRPYDVVANLPYHVTSPVLHLLLAGDQAPRPRRLVLMLQREVAARVAAPPGAMSYLSVFVQYHAVPTVVRVVPREAFEPAPDVASAVLALDVRPDDAPGRLPAEMEDSLWRLVQAGFRERRKMLHNVLPRQLPVPADAVRAALDAAGIDGERRPQSLDVGEWIGLLGALGPVAADRRGLPGAGAARRAARAAAAGESASDKAGEDAGDDAGDPVVDAGDLGVDAGDLGVDAGDLGVDA